MSAKMKEAGRGKVAKAGAGEAGARRSAKKPALIFIHGFRGNHLGLAEVADEFPDYDVHVPDIAPAGGKRFEKYDMPTYTKYIADYIREHKLEKPVLIGHSLGSIIAAATASRYPDLINEKLVLLAPIAKKPAKFFGSLVPLTVFLPARVVDYVTTRYLFVPHDHELFKKSLATTHLCGADFASKMDVAKAGKFSAAHSIRDFQFEKDTVLIAGERDRLMPLKNTRALAEEIGAEVKVVKNAGHILNYERPKETAQAIRDFLEK